MRTAREKLMTTYKGTSRLPAEFSSENVGDRRQLASVFKVLKNKRVLYAAKLTLKK